VPELPEVETTRRGIQPLVLGLRIERTLIRESRLRWPIPEDLPGNVRRNTIVAVGRRGKYLLLELERGTIIVHLGMSGSLRVVPRQTPPGKHDHLDLVLENGTCLRLHDPRRFGAVLYTPHPAQNHPLLAKLGPEPLDRCFEGSYLYREGKRRRCPVKAMLMDAKVVVGVGNIYSNEALFLAGIRPTRPCHRISQERYHRLVKSVRSVLLDAIDQGGTTLRDFVREDGTPGYFSVRLRVYGKGGTACPNCGTGILLTKISQRASYYCPRCQR